MAVPPLGSPQDAYLQLLMNREVEKEFTAKAFQAYAVWATAGGEGAKKFAELSSTTFEKLMKLYFPHVRQTDSKEVAKRDLAFVERLFKQHGTPIPGVPKPEAPKRPSIWKNMIDTLTGKKEK